MNKLFYVLLFVFVIPAFNAYASKEVGNGGDAVVCRRADRSIEKIELFDYYEARVMRQMDLNFSDATSTEDVFALLLQRMARISKSRAKQYAEWGASFTKEARFLEGVELPDIPDSGPIPFPYGCKIEQLVIQKAPSLPGDRRYTVNKELWDALSVADRAGIIMHELLYREAIQKWKHDNSVLVRYFNSVLASPVQLEEVLKSDQSLVGFLQLVHFYEAEIHGIHIDLKNSWTRFHSEGQLSSASTLYDGETLMVYGQPVTLKAGTWLQFFPSGAVMEMTGSYFDPFTQRRFGWTTFYEDGHIETGKLPSGETIIEPNSGLKLKEYVSFDRFGWIKSGQLASTSIQTAHFEICGSSLQGRVEFTKSGISTLTLYAVDPKCSWAEVGGGRTSFDGFYPHLQLNVINGYIVNRLLTPTTIDTWAGVQDQKVKLKKGTYFDVGEKGVLTHCYLDDERGFIELRVGERSVAFEAQAFQSPLGKTASPELSIFWDGSNSYIESGVLARDTMLPTPEGEKMFPSHHVVRFNKEGMAE